MRNRTGVIALVLFGLVVTACTQAAPTASGSSSAAAAADEESGTATPDEAEGDKDGGDDNDGNDSDGGGGATGPVFGGSIEQAIPPVVGGEQVTVFGPISGEEVEEQLEGGSLTAEQEELMELLGLTAGDIEIAFGFSESVIITVMRLPGRSSEEIDSAFVEVFEAASGTGNFRVENVAGRNVHAYESLFPSNYAWVNGDILFIVAATEEGGPQAVAAMPPPTVPLTVAGGEGEFARTEVELTLVGGDDAGDYEGETDEGGCSRNPFGDENGPTFGLQYSTSEAGIVFSSFQLVIEDADAAADGTDQFFATITVNRNDYSLDPADGDGTGEVQLDDSGGDDAVIELSGETADGVIIQATVTCNFILDFGS